MYKSRWDAYERTYRGFWSANEKSRDGERSRIIAPALSQAIDSTAASIEDAIFSRDQWFDVKDDFGDQQRDDVETARLRLVEDFEVAGVPEQIAKVVLNGCLYGTGVGKINITRREVKTVTPTPQGPKVRTEVRPVVTLDAIPPWEFVIDTQALTRMPVTSRALSSAPMRPTCRVPPYGRSRSRASTGRSTYRAGRAR
jgi:hypothetical protein